MFTIVRWDSQTYREAIILRNELLKASAGQPYMTASPISEINDIHLVVKRNGVTVGTLLMHPCSSNCIQIKQVAIHPDYQGRSLGKRLIMYAEKVARNFNFSIIFLTGRKQAWGFYEKMGYCDLMDAYHENGLTLKVFKKELVYFSKKKEMKTNG